MNILEIKYLKNFINDDILAYIKNNMPNRFEQSLKFKSLEMRNLFLLSCSIIINNMNCKENDILYNKYNKPYLINNLYFNVSNKKDYVVFVKSKNNIGIDIELIQNNYKSIIDKAFNENEKELIINGNKYDTEIERLIYFWTLKESIYKASGICKSFIPSDIVVDDSSCIKFFDKFYYIKTCKFYDYIITVASIEKFDDMVIVQDFFNL